MTDAIATGIAVTLLLLCALHWKLAGLPARLWGLAQNARDELDRARAADDARAQKALAEAVSARAGVLLAGVRQYQEQMAAGFRKQIADAELRARVADRNAVDTATALETATSLVRGLRTTLDGLGELPALVREAREARRRRRGGTLPPPEDAAPPEPDDNRKTIEIPAPAPIKGAPIASETVDDAGWDDPEERTRVFGADQPSRQRERRAPTPRGLGDPSR
jgi:hypothetical protein